MTLNKIQGEFEGRGLTPERADSGHIAVSPEGPDVSSSKSPLVSCLPLAPWYGFSEWRDYTTGEGRGTVSADSWKAANGW